jgi:hypothetical protein
MPDLDQTLHIERDDDGYVVRYVIADMAAFVVPDGPIDREAHRRGETLCGADPGSRCTRSATARAASHVPTQVHHARRTAGEVLVRDHAIGAKVPWLPGCCSRRARSSPVAALRARASG